MEEGEQGNASNRLPDQTKSRLKSKPSIQLFQTHAQRVAASRGQSLSPPKRQEVQTSQAGAKGPSQATKTTGLPNATKLSRTSPAARNLSSRRSAGRGAGNKAPGSLVSSIRNPKLLNKRNSLSSSANQTSATPSSITSGKGTAGVQQAGQPGEGREAGSSGGDGSSAMAGIFQPFLFPTRQASRSLSPEVRQSTMGGFGTTGAFGVALSPATEQSGSWSSDASPSPALSGTFRGFGSQQSSPAFGKPTQSLSGFAAQGSQLQPRSSLFGTPANFGVGSGEGAELGRNSHTASQEGLTSFTTPAPTTTEAAEATKPERQTSPFGKRSAENYPWGAGGVIGGSLMQGFGSLPSPASNQGGNLGPLASPQTPAILGAVPAKSGEGGRPQHSEPQTNPFSIAAQTMAAKPVFGTAWSNASSRADTPASTGLPASTPEKGSGFTGMSNTAIGSSPVPIPASGPGDAGSASPASLIGGLQKDEATLKSRAERFGSGAEALSQATSPLERLAPGNEASMEIEGEGIGKGMIEGTCTQMCPPKEQDFRKRISDIDSFERLQEGGPPDLAVKKFARNVDQERSNFRTMDTLQRTQAHLLSIMDRTDVPLSKIHHFLWDRYRGIRQDLFVQGYEDASAIVLYEEHVRFMILTEHELSGLPMDVFNSHLNLEQINKACISLNSMYDEARQRGSPMPNEGEFRTYHLLLLMGTHGKYRYNSTEYRKALKECEPVSHHPAFKLAMSLQGLLSQGNWSSFFQQTLKAPYLLAALAHLYFPALRLHALRVLSRTLADPSKDFLRMSLNHFMGELYLDSTEQASKICEALKLGIAEEGSGPLIQIPKRRFAPQAGEMPVLRCQQITDKAATPRSMDVAQTTIPAAWDPSQLPSQTSEQINPSTDQQQLQLLEMDSLQADIQARRREAWLAQKDALEREQRLEAETRQREAERVAAAQAVLQRQQQQEREEAERQRTILKATEDARLAQLEIERKERMEKEQIQKQEQLQREAEERRQKAEEEEMRRKIELERERKVKEKQREQEAKERKRKEAEEEARRHAERVRQNQEKACVLLQSFATRFTKRSCLIAWCKNLELVKEERKLKEQRQQDALARCRIGLPKSPPAEAWQHLVAAEPIKRVRQKQIQQRPPFLDISVALEALSTNSPGVKELFWKLSIMHASTGAATESRFVTWMRQSIFGTEAFGDGDAILKTKAEILTKGQGSVIVRYAVRDISKCPGKSTAPEGSRGSSALILCISVADDPRKVGAEWRALLQQLPQAAAKGAGPPLLVMVESQALVEPVKAWLAEEMALDLAKHVGNSRVEALPQQGDDAKRGALLKGIMWLSEQTKPQPCLKVTDLSQVTRDTFDRELATVSAESCIDPQALIKAYNRSLDSASVELQRSASEAENLQGWPPMDCLLTADSTWLPVHWSSEKSISVNRANVKKLALPPFPHPGDTEEEIGELVIRYLGTDAQMPMLATKGGSWHQLLLEAMHMRLLSLDEEGSKTVLLCRQASPPMTAVPLLAFTAMSLSPLELPSKRKRELTNRSPVPQKHSTPSKMARFSLQAGPAAASPLSWTTGTPQPWATGTPRPFLLQRTASPPEDHLSPCDIAGNSPHSDTYGSTSQKDTEATPTLAALLDEYRLSTCDASGGTAQADGFDAELDEERSKSEALTQYLRAILQEGNSNSTPIQRNGHQQYRQFTLEEEFAATSRFTRELHEIKGGF